ncbi:MAG TPA: hypothetical protein VER12_16505 [Polyangiaceae bacterium]|nr:hypothetical protein [Polyangiaceae bacterium]
MKSVSGLWSLWPLLLTLLSECSKPPPHSPAQTPASSLPASAPSELIWHYRVRFEAGSELFVQARFDSETDGVFAIDDELSPYVQKLEIAQGDHFVPVAKRDASSWFVPCSAGCSIRYRFALREATESLGQPDTAIASGDVLISPPSNWLLHPGLERRNGEFELEVEPGAEARFVSAFEPISAHPANHYRATIGVLEDASFAAFGPLHLVEIPAGDGTVQLGVATRNLALTAAQAQAWVATSASAVASYYRGHLPARRTLVLLMQGSGESTRGITLGGGGPGILVRAADHMTPENTRDDWVVTHELLHANFPDVGPAHSWLSEGLATYLEPIIRTRAGLVNEAKVWRDMVDGMPQGLPQAGDRGLEYTRTWGRTYWGGALFCLVADVELREKTGNRHSLDDVLLAIGKTGDSDEDYWPIERVLEMAERATSTQIFAELFERLAKKPGTIDLAALFSRLGVRAQGDSVVFDEHAPLAALRKSITARRPD